MKKLIYILIFIAFAGIANGQWQSIGPKLKGTFYEVLFLNENTGFVVGKVEDNGVIYKTINGGVNWSQVMGAGNQQYMYSIYFVNSSIGFAVGVGNMIYKTQNGGQDWVGAGMPSATKFKSIRFINAQTGLVCGDDDNPNRGPIYKTTNGGYNWIKVNNSVAHMDKIYYLDANNVYASGDYAIWKSTDAGNTWADIYPFNRDCNDIFFLNTNTGFVCGNYTMIKTSNAGINWNEFTLSSPTDTNMHFAIYFTDNNNGYFSSISMSPPNLGKVYKTTNSGVNWNLQLTIPLKYFYSIMFINPNTGFACGGGNDSTIIYKTTNGGGVWVQNISTEIPSSYSLSQNYPNPFNPTTKIKFDVVRAGDVKIIVYDLMGREVQTLVNESLKPGTYEASFDGSQLTSGVYFYKIVADNFVETKKMLMIK